ncbi:MAG: hypothetical protein AB1609_15405 [Bacillota bacterium]
MSQHRFSTVMRSLACALSLGATAGAAQAGLCTLTNVGDQCVINWDASSLGQGPYEAYVSMSSGLVPGNSLVSWSWFDGLNASGVQVSSGGPRDWMNALLSAPWAGSAMWSDGRASLRLTAVFGATDIYLSTVRFTDMNGVTFAVDGTAQAVNTVPTPGSAALLAAAFLGFGVAMRKRPR